MVRIAYESVTVHEKICPSCGSYVEVLPDHRWEAEYHFRGIGDAISGRIITQKCPGSGQFIEQGNSRKRIMVRVKGG